MVGRRQVSFPKRRQLLVVSEIRDLVPTPNPSSRTAQRQGTKLRALALCQGAAMQHELLRSEESCLKRQKLTAQTDPSLPSYPSAAVSGGMSSISHCEAVDDSKADEVGEPAAISCREVGAARAMHAPVVL